MSVNQPMAVRFGAGCILEPSLVFKYSGPAGPSAAITIGDRVFMGRGCEFNIVLGIEIGSDTLIASGCRFVDHDHGFSVRHIVTGKQPHTAGRIVIGENVWLGSGVTVLKGVSIGQGAIVAAGAVVGRSINPYEIWGGIPARKISDRPDPGTPAGSSG